MMKVSRRRFLLGSASAAVLPAPTPLAVGTVFDYASLDTRELLARTAGVKRSIDNVWTADGRVLGGTPTRSFLDSADWYYGGRYEETRR